MIEHTNSNPYEEIVGFVPMRLELCAVVKYWMMEIIDYNYFVFCYQQPIASLSQRSAGAGQRINQIAALIGEDAVKRAIDEAYEEYGRNDKSRTWRIFRHGTAEERREHYEECAAENAAIR